MRLSIITISFNTIDLTRQCLRSLHEITDYKIGTDFEVIVVDNSSQDASKEMVRKEFPAVKLVESMENLGFSRGNNLGLKHADPATPYVLFLNSDTVVPDQNLATMVKFMDAHPEVGVASCKVVLANGELDLDSHRGFPTPWVSLTRILGLHKWFPRSRLFNGYFLGWKDLTTTHEVDALVGAYMLVKREAGDKIGWWDEDYFLNGEDIEFCFEIKAKGYQVMYHPATSITHYRGASKGIRKETIGISTATIEGKRTSLNAGMDAMQIFYNKHYRQKYNFIMNFFVDIGISLLRLKRLILLKK